MKHWKYILEITIFIPFFYNQIDISMAEISLTEDQIQGTIIPLATTLGLSEKKEILFNGPIIYKREIVEKYKLHEYSGIAKKYILEKYEDSEKKPFYFLILISPTYTKKSFLACEFFNHFLEDVKTSDRPRVYVLPNFFISDANFKKISSNIVNVPYRLVPIDKIYPILYTPQNLKISSQRLMTYNFERLNTKEKTFSNLEWPLIRDSDPISLVVNALPGELIRCKRTILDGMSPYSEFEIRRVYKTKSDIGEIADSGVDGLNEY